jgi:transcriptional regulator with XRE-family HTH domain
MEQGWDAVAAAINTRLEELGMTQVELSARSGVSVATLRQLQRNDQPRRRNPRTLAAVSEGLRWPKQHLARVLEGDNTDEPTNLAEEVRLIRAELGDLRSRIEAVERDRHDG